MSAEIKMPAVATPPIVIKVGGKCYSLQGEGKLGKPNNSLSNIQWSGSTCVACQATGTVPAVCPCTLGLTWGTFPCGGEGENILGTYNITLTDVIFTVAYQSVGSDVTEMSNISYSAGTSCLWRYQSGSLDRRVPGTTIGTSDFQLTLYGGVYWRFLLYSGSAVGIWVKRDGDNPEGPYTILENGDVSDGITNRAVSPSRMEISAP